MEVLGFDATETQVFWDGAVKQVRGTRIADGISLATTTPARCSIPRRRAAYDRLQPEVLQDACAPARSTTCTRSPPFRSAPHQREVCLMPTLRCDPDKSPPPSKRRWLMP